MNPAFFVDFLVAGDCCAARDTTDGEVGCMELEAAADPCLKRVERVATAGLASIGVAGLLAFIGAARIGVAVGFL